MTKRMTVNDVFGDRSNDLFDLVPHMDNDGDHDLRDFIILDELLQEEKKPNEKLFDDDDWREICEDGSEFDLDPEDFDTEEECEEALARRGRCRRYRRPAVLMTRNALRAARQNRKRRGKYVSLARD